MPENFWAGKAEWDKLPIMQTTLPLLEQPLEYYLKYFFGYNEFRNCQKAIVGHILNRQDVVAILPTGAGKSICYQLPALLLPGLTIVVSPLISLMQDQVVSLYKNGIQAAFLNSSLPPHEIHAVLNNLGNYKLLYVAPERFADEHFLQLLQKAQVSLFAIDEAHCISQWGHSFRPDYRQLSFIKEKFPHSSVIALTATATGEVEKDIISQLKMTSPQVIKTSFNRTNLSIRICRKEEKDALLAGFLEKHANQSGILYASTRKGVDEAYEMLRLSGLAVGKYHAGLSDAERAEAHHAFTYGKTLVMVATVAFGMGIHKPDIRFIVHLDMPRSIEQYYQEIGRAGRDGLPAECLMFYSGKELALYEFFSKQETDPVVVETSLQKSKKMYWLCCSEKCRRRELLRYFGEVFEAPNCESCDNCNDDTEEIDATVIAQKILSCVYRVQQRFGARHVIDVLKGAKTKGVFERQHDTLSTYALMADSSEDELRYYIEALIHKGFLKRSEGEYPVLQWTEASREVTAGKVKVLLRRKKNIQIQKRASASMAYDDTLYRELVELRNRWAQKTQVPAYVVFGDKSLMEMAAQYPRTEEAFLAINGVGPLKWKQYGQDFMGHIASYCTAHGIAERQGRGALAPAKARPAASLRSKPPSSEESVGLFAAGNTIDQVAQQRGVSPRTIVNHLVEAIMQGQDIDISSVVPQGHRDLIEGAIISLGADRLAPIKAALPDYITYEEINLVAAFHRRPG